MRDAVLAGVPARLADLASGRRLCVLAYHGIDDPRRFATHLDWLAGHRTIVSLDDVVAALRGGHRLPPRATLLTFDDGERSLLEHGAPLLAAHGLPAVAFVAAGLIGTDQPFWWSEVAELVTNGGRAPAAIPGDPVGSVRAFKKLSDSARRSAIDALRLSADRPATRTRQLDAADLQALDAAGVRVENHSYSHACLTRCDDSTLADEIERSHKTLTGMLGREPVAFAYPNGDWDARAHRLLGSMGYAAAFLFDHRLAHVPGTDPLRISRVRIDSTSSLDRLRMMTTGLHPLLHRMRGRR